MALDVQEEVTRSTYKLGLKVGELTLEALVAAWRAFREHSKTVQPGRQSLLKIVRGGGKISTVTIKEADLKGFVRFAKQYGASFAAKLDRADGNYIILFQANRAEQMDIALKAYAKHKLAREQQQRESILARLRRQGVRSKEFEQVFPSLAAPPEAARLPDRAQSREASRFDMPARAGSQPGQSRAMRPPREVER